MVMVTFDPATPPTVSVGSQPLFVAIGDFNGDTVQDLAVALGDNAVFIQLGNGNGTFDRANPAVIDVGSGPTSVAIGDFNGDTVQDLADN